MTPETQTGVAMAGIGMVGTIVGLLVGFLKDRDKLKHDAATVRRDADIAILKEHQQRCEDEARRCREEHALAQAEIAKLHARDVDDKSELQSQIDAIVRTIAGHHPTQQPLSGKLKKLPPHE